MKVFVAGATGVIGWRLVPAILGRGHTVVGTTRTPSKQTRLRELGAEPILLDALDEIAVKQAVMDAEPDVVVHQLTALPPSPDPRHFDDEFAATNQLRTQGTAHLLEAARSSGVGRIIVQSYAGWPYARTGGPVKTESDPLDDSPPAPMQRTLDAIREMEALVSDRTHPEGVVLRYGAFYGPGTGIGHGGAIIDALRRRRFPIVGSGGGIWSFVHADDAVEATTIAIDSGAPGIYNVVDDDPASVSEWLPHLAGAVAAPRPRHVPAWLARLLIGEAGVSLMTEIRGASNAKAKGELGWEPGYPTWREGFLHGLL
jgi:nucleoside-diphosphate-sugar epimerase